MTCRYTEFCGLEATYSGGDAVYCILHLPNPQKSSHEFRLAFDKMRKEDVSNFSHFYFPFECKDILFGLTFNNKLVLNHAKFNDDAINLKGVTLNGGCDVTADIISDLTLQGAVVAGALTLRFKEVKGTLSLDGTTFENLVDIRATRIQNISATGKATAFMGHTIIECDNVTQASFLSSRLHNSELKIQSSSQLYFQGVHFADACNIKATMVDTISLQSANIEGNLSIDTAQNSGITLDDANISGKFKLNGKTRAISFRNATFSNSSTLDLENAIIEGNFELKGRVSSPKTVIINKTEFLDSVSIEGAFGHAPIQVVAESDRPLFLPTKTVLFRNVDLSNCCLVGNDIQKLVFDNVRWKKRWGRNILRDEQVYKRDKNAPLGNLKEAYQILKEWYKQRGDHATSGDFHYGEMEARRRGERWYKSTPEFLYWACSGYGIRYQRALMILVFLIVAAAYIYMSYGSGLVKNDFLESLLFSLQVSSLQRPTLPHGQIDLVRWVYAVESIVVPIQAALFVLALRMRLKR